MRDGSCRACACAIKRKKKKINKLASDRSIDKTKQKKGEGKEEEKGNSSIDCRYIGRAIGRAGCIVDNALRARRGYVLLLE